MEDDVASTASMIEDKVIEMDIKQTEAGRGKRSHEASRIGRFAKCGFVMDIVDDLDLFSRYSRQKEQPCAI
jgi:hypothetical protein